MKIRIGIDGRRHPAVLARLDALAAPLLVSANAMWRPEQHQFRGWNVYAGRDAALDSGGFVAMKLYGGFRWSVPQYVKLAADMCPTWWAQMDLCCEPELASDRAGVRSRIHATATYLRECEAVAAGTGTLAPMPVMQGWHPEDYCHGPIYDRTEFPALVGVGSVCRRDVAGVLAVVAALDAALPAHVRLHLFGVKSQALSTLLRWYPHRLASIDSMAWSRACGWHCFNTGSVQTGALRADFAERWYDRQQERARRALEQTQLPL